MKNKRLIIKDHNKEAYEKVREAFKEKQRTCVIHATGTGKAYIALQCIRDIDEKVVYITSMKANLVRFQDQVDTYFEGKDVLYCLYAGLSGQLREIESESVKLIILDEFHRAGAREWNKYVVALLEQHPEAKVLGLTATEVRYLDGERNMAEELFFGNIASTLPLDEAIVRGILPVPEYTICVASYKDKIREMEKSIVADDVSDKNKARMILTSIKKKLENAEGMPEYFARNIKKKNGKYLVFCSNYEHLCKMKEESKKWFAGTKVSYYKMYSDDTKAQYNLEKFEEDETDSLKLLFVISMLNEGVHIDGIDGCILLRETESPNVYFQQIGRALSANSRKTPVILDVVNNVDKLYTVRDFWNGLGDRILKEGKKDDRKFRVFSKDVDIIREIEAFRQLTGEAAQEKRWQLGFELAQECKRTRYSNLKKVPLDYVTEEGFPLGVWIFQQKKLLRTGKLDEKKIELLGELEIKLNEQRQRKSTKWSDKEDEIIRKLYPSEGSIIAALMEEKTQDEVRARASQIGVKFLRPKSRSDPYDSLRSEYYKRYANLWGSMLREQKGSASYEKLRKRKDALLLEYKEYMKDRL